MEQYESRLSALESSMESVKSTTSDLQKMMKMLLANQGFKKTKKIKKIKRHQEEELDNASEGESETGYEASHKDSNLPSDSEVAENDSETGLRLERPVTCWVRDVKMPLFEGEEPMGWIAHAEKFFEVQRVNQNMWLQLAFISMEGNALHWFQYWKKNTKRQSWSSFTTALLKRYSGDTRGDVYEHLAALRQTGTMTEFIQEFELLMAQISGAKEAQLCGYFLAGLRAEMRSKIRPHKPANLLSAMELAAAFEDATREEKADDDFRGQGFKSQTRSNPFS